MAKQTFAYFHDDISALAKSLKRQLDTHGRLPTHTQLLKMLAHASGSQNYQSWRPASAHSAHLGALATLRIDSAHPAATEIFEHAPDGSVVDPRHEPVASRFALIDIGLSIGRYEGIVRCRVSASTHLLNMEAQEHLEDHLRLVALRSLHERMEDDDHTVTVVGDVILNLDQFLTEETHAFDGEKVEQVHISHKLAKKLRSECTDSLLGSQAFEEIRDALRTTMKRSNPSAFFSRNAELSREVANYLDAFVEASGELFMHSWNIEKLGFVADLLRSAANGKQVGETDWNIAKRGLSSALGPNHWNNLIAAPKQVPERFAVVT